MDEQPIDELTAKRPKLQFDCSTSPKPEFKNSFLSLPPDVLAKIICHLPIAQWFELELLDENVQAATLIAYRQIRRIDFDREFEINPAKFNDQSSYYKSVESILRTLVERSPFLTSLSGIVIHSGNAESNSGIIRALAQFEHLQSISMDRQGIILSNVVEFLDATRSRTSLKELYLFNVDYREFDRGAMLTRLDAAIAPLKLETFSCTSSYHMLFFRLDTMDTSRLTDLLVGKVSIEPAQLSNLIERAPNLRRIELTFLHSYGSCGYYRKQATKNLLTALASHENLTAVKLDYFGAPWDLHHHCYYEELVPEFIEMLKTMGRRGLLRKLALEKQFIPSLTDYQMDDICATISDHLPRLRSIKLDLFERMEPNTVYNIVSNLTELEVIRFSSCRKTMTLDAVKKISELPHLKRLALDAINDRGESWLKCLGDVTTLTDLRIVFVGHKVDADVFEKWSDGFASNLQILMLSGTPEEGTVRLLKKAARLRVLMLRKKKITTHLLTTIANSCPELEILGVESTSIQGEIYVQCLQKIVDRCSKLEKLGRFSGMIRDQLQFPKYRKIRDVDWQYWSYDSRQR